MLTYLLVRRIGRESSMDDHSANFRESVRNSKERTTLEKPREHSKERKTTTLDLGADLLRRRNAIEISHNFGCNICSSQMWHDEQPTNFGIMVALLGVLGIFQSNENQFLSTCISSR